MRDTRQPLTPNADLGTRILARDRAKRGFMRARPPLVLRRPGAPARAGMLPSQMCVAASHYHFALQLHLSMLWGPSTVRRLGSLGSETRDPALRTLLTLAPPMATAHQAHAGAAPRRLAAAPSPRALGPAPSTTASSNHPLSSTGPVRAVDATPREPLARRVVPNGKSGSSGPDGHNRSNGHGGRAGSTHTVLTKTVAPERGRHSVQTADTTFAVSRVPSITDRALRASRRRPAGFPAHGHGDSRGPVAGRTASSRALRAGISAPLPPVLMALTRSSPDRLGVERSTLYAQPASRSLAVAPAGAQAPPASPEPRSMQAPPPPVPSPPPPIDVGQLSEDVYQHIQRRIRIERERRGL